MGVLSRAPWQNTDAPETGAAIRSIGGGLRWCFGLVKVGLGRTTRTSQCGAGGRGGRTASRASATRARTRRGTTSNRQRRAVHRAALPTGAAGTRSATGRFAASDRSLSSQRVEAAQIGNLHTWTPPGSARGRQFWSMAPTADPQQQRLLELLRQAGEQPVSFAELHAGGIAFTAAVVGELELNEYRIERVHDHGRLLGVRLLQPEPRTTASHGGGAGRTDSQSGDAIADPYIRGRRMDIRTSSCRCPSCSLISSEGSPSGRTGS